MTFNLDWEELTNSELRLKVPFGWIYKTYEDVSHFTEDRGLVDQYDWRVAVCFIFDPFHLWLKNN